MKVYKAKTTFDGFKIGMKNSDKYIGVPKGKGYTIATIFGQEIVLGDPVCENTFKDKYGRGDYTLQYYKITDGEQTRLI